MSGNAILMSWMLAAGALVLSPPVVEARDEVNEAVVARIKIEAFQSSRLMETLGELTDRFGPRLGGSPAHAEAARWARDRLSSWGLVDARLERFEQEGPGWSLSRFSVELLEPRYQHLVAHPQAWSPGIDGVLEGRPRLVDVRSTSDFAAYRGTLAGAIVMNGPAGIVSPDAELPSGRLTDDELLRRSRQIDPGARGFGPFTRPSYRRAREESARRSQAQYDVLDFFREEGVAALILPDRTGGLVVHADGSYGRLTEAKFPIFVMAAPHYGRIARLIATEAPVRLALSLEVRFHPKPFAANVLADITGSGPEIVLLGAHLDSVISATGATDDAAGCAVMMEVARILRTIEPRPRRTIRVALWGSEELGHLGSRAHVERHYGNLDTLQPGRDHARLSAYFNLDNGSGRIRGVYLQGNEAVRPIFEAYLKPFHYLGARTVTILNTGGTDHEPFDALGLPAFQFLQDALDYETFLSHSNHDLYEAVDEEDLMQAAAVVASFAYHTAMRGERLPRKPRTTSGQ